MGNRQNVNSISRAANILRCIADGSNRITQIASKADLSNGTAHRLLKSLQKEGFVEQDPLTLKYSLGPLLIALSTNPMVTHANLVSCAIEEMEILRQTTGETVGLVIRSGLQRLHLEELASKHALKFTMGKGVVAPIHLAASSKALLAQMPLEDRDKLLSLIEEKKVQRESGFKKADLLKELSQVEKNGYATSCGEYVPGAGSIAVPVKGYVAPVAICIFGPLERFDLKRMKKVLPDLKRASKRITEKLV
jgi:IclR family acetate operon transcriptional repressor